MTDHDDGPVVIDIDAMRREAEGTPVAVVRLAGETFTIHRHNVGARFIRAAKADDPIGMIAAVLDDDRIGCGIDLGLNEIKMIMAIVEHEMGFDEPGEASASPVSSSIITTPSRPTYNATTEPIS